ncbi:MAG: histidine phosphatase family protein [Cellvibrionaceae bacterium]|nr:histidine phosphatase family protein [Cellvibrionaceae bacterium]
MSEFLLVRHGQASFGSDNYDQLSDLGWQQARWLGEYFQQKDRQFDDIITGKLVRHRETAQGICEGLGLNRDAFTEHGGLNEFDFHSVVSAYLRQFPQEMPTDKSDARPFFKILKKAMEAWRNDELSAPVPESWGQFEQRVGEALAFIQDNYTGKKLLVVSSGGAIAMAMKHVLGYGDDMVMNINMQVINSSVSRFVFSPRNVRLASFNSIPHLDDNDRSDAVTYS